MKSGVAQDDFLAEYDASKTPYRMRYLLYRDRMVEVRLSSMGHTNWRRTVPLRQLMDSYQEVDSRVRSPKRALQVATCVGIVALIWMFGFADDQERSMAYFFGFGASVLAWFLTPQVPIHWVQFLPSSGAKSENGLAILDAGDGPAFDEFVSLVAKLIRAAHLAASGDPLAGDDSPK